MASNRTTAIVQTLSTRSLFSASSLVAAACAVFLGCSPESPKLVPLPLVKKERVKDTGGNKVVFNRGVDILFVIDDSGSMSSHQANLANNIQVFTKAFAGNQLLDWHLGVVTSSMDGNSTGTLCRGGDGALFGCPNFVDRLTPNAATVLNTNLQPGTGGSGTEQFFSPVKAALTPPMVSGRNAGFYRSDAYLVVIFVTDAEEQSRMTARETYDFLLNLKGGDAAKIITYGVYIPSSSPSSCSRDESTLPTKLEEFFRISGAKTLGLCDADYGQKLAGLGDDLAKRISSVLYLTRPAQPDTIKVTFGSQVIPNDPKTGWVFDPARNALVFGQDIDMKPEPPGTQVEVDFIAAEY